MPHPKMLILQLIRLEARFAAYQRANLQNMSFITNLTVSFVESYKVHIFIYLSFSCILQVDRVFTMYYVTK